MDPLFRILPRELAEVTMVSAIDHLGYSPLLPEVAHLAAIPYRASKLRVATDWLVNLVSRPAATQLGLVQESAAHRAADTRR